MSATGSIPCSRRLPTKTSRDVIQRHDVQSRPQAVEDIEGIFRDILQSSRDAVTAERFVRRLLARCDRIGDAPHGGAPRDDLAPGVRLVPFEVKIVILHVVRDGTVLITNVIWGRRDYSALMRGFPPET